MVPLPFDLTELGTSAEEVSAMFVHCTSSDPRDDLPVFSCVVLLCFCVYVLTTLSYSLCT